MRVLGDRRLSHDDVPDWEAVSPLKILVGPDQTGYVRVSRTSADDLARRYGVPCDLVANMAGFVAMLEGTIGVE